MAYYALFVANARYHSEGLPPLHGPEFDVDDLCGLFTHRLGYDDAQVLKGASADEVSVSFNRLGSRAKPGDTVLFYFSGHGVESIDRQEQYLLFEYADLNELTRGINTPTGCLAVSKLLNNSDHWSGVQRVFVFDACRVLLAAKGGAASAVEELRFGREEVLNALARGPQLGHKARTAAPSTVPTAAPPVLIKACLSSQQALELPGRKRGVFSLAFGEVLKEAARQGQGLSTGPALLAQIQQGMSPWLGQLAGHPKQTPWISDDAPAVPLFPATVVPTPPPPPDLEGLLAEFEQHMAAGRLQGGRQCAGGALVALEMAGAGSELIDLLQKRLNQATDPPRRMSGGMNSPQVRPQQAASQPSDNWTPTGQAQKAPPAPRKVSPYPTRATVPPLQTPRPLPGESRRRERAATPSVDPKPVVDPPPLSEAEALMRDEQLWVLVMREPTIERLRQYLAEASADAPMRQTASMRLKQLKEGQSVAAAEPRTAEAFRARPPDTTRHPEEKPRGSEWTPDPLPDFKLSLDKAAALLSGKKRR